MNIRKCCLMALSSLIWVCSANALEKESFPPGVSGMKKVDVKIYEDVLLGYSVRYVGPGNVKCDFFVYGPDGMTIPDGVNSDAVKKAFEQAQAEIRRMERNGDYRDVKLLENNIVTVKALAGKTLDFLHARYSFRLKNDTEVLSDLYLSGYEGQFLKIRFSSSSGLKNFPRDAVLNNLFQNDLGKIILYTGTKTDVDEDVKETIYRTVKLIEDSPLDEGPIAIPALLKFVDDSSDVIVYIQDATMAWLGGVPAARRKLFTAAFFGGNIRAQLEKNICRDMPLEGLKCVLKTYRSLKAADAETDIPVLENMLKLEAENKLEEMLPESRIR